MKHYLTDMQRHHARRLGAVLLADYFRSCGHQKYAADKRAGDEFGVSGGTVARWARLARATNIGSKEWRDALMPKAYRQLVRVMVAEHQAAVALQKAKAEDRIARRAAKAAAR